MSMSESINHKKIKKSYFTRHGNFTIKSKKQNFNYKKLCTVQL